MKRLTTTKQVIEELGGMKQVANLTARGYTAVHNWKQYGTFPATTYDLLLKALKKQECTADPRLWGMEQVAEP